MEIWLVALYYYQFPDINNRLAQHSGFQSLNFGFKFDWQAHMQEGSFKPLQILEFVNFRAQLF